MPYTKLFSTIVGSTIWQEDDQTRIIWITMLALADKNGEVHCAIPGLAKFAGVPIEATERALAKFLAPEKYPRRDDGRRIEEIDDGWVLLNHGYYRRKASKDEQKEANAERQRRFRKRQKEVKSNVTVTDSNGSVTHDRDIAEADTEAKGIPRNGRPPKRINQTFPPSGHPLDEPYHG